MGINTRIIFATGLIAIAPVLASPNVHSSAESPDSFIPPYSATYSTVWKKGISLKVEGTQTLSKTSDNVWNFKFKASTLIASLHEEVSFTKQDETIVPLSYFYKSQVLGKKRKATLTFDWDKNTVKNDIKNKPWNMKIEEGTIDKLGVQLQIRNDLRNHKKDLTYKIADGGHVKHWSFARRGTETIDTKIGRVNAIKVERTDNTSKKKQTYFWFAPSLNYLLVKMEHYEDGESYKLNLEKLNEKG
ncbi:DUF3108 domain-containing protein [Marinomonas mediterranea]|jgi:Protein of unknown function (DUF3108).|uniref:DUF3108 domain-containing protein n=1 Tax=Marinomonas mediterranea (strain ATCC 700492 / JCM 21426 / NBRC 103028 / MMB-1) TaxID=717774 RepID=F2JY34_MARM1|nr:DUF3108 domain-containing protein [Marinomonas mediterranea]ADZ90770.1 hypothetical protein Marme_1503 [Marinomonas mediterranea MMB-1]WCN16924.1 DUF3108 domain-containing protein [Marinomonas mediterranea MMB-1]